jgi:hypothetical protein
MNWKGSVNSAADSGVSGFNQRHLKSSDCPFTHYEAPRAFRAEAPFST